MIESFGILLNLFYQTKLSLEKVFILVEQKKEEEAENSLNGFFTNIDKYLEILAYNVADTFHHNFSNHPAWQATTKYRNHSSIDSIKSHFKHNANLFFSKVDKNTALKKIKKLETNRAVSKKIKKIRNK